MFTPTFAAHKAETCTMCDQPFALCTCDDPIEYALTKEEPETPVVITATAQEVFILRKLIADALQQLYRVTALEETCEEVQFATELLQTALYGDYAA